MIIIKKSANSLAFLDFFCANYGKKNPAEPMKTKAITLFITSVRLIQIAFDTPDIIKAYNQAISKSFSTFHVEVDILENSMKKLVV